MNAKIKTGTITRLNVFILVAALMIGLSGCGASKSKDSSSGQTVFELTDTKKWAKSFDEENPPKLRVGSEFGFGEMQYEKASSKSDVVSVFEAISEVVVGPFAGDEDDIDSDERYVFEFKGDSDSVRFEFTDKYILYDGEAYKTKYVSDLIGTAKDCGLIKEQDSSGWDDADENEPEDTADNTGAGGDEGASDDGTPAPEPEPSPEPAPSPGSGNKLVFSAETEHGGLSFLYDESYRIGESTGSSCFYVYMGQGKLPQLYLGILKWSNDTTAADVLEGILYQYDKEGFNGKAQPVKMEGHQNMVYCSHVYYSEYDECMEMQVAFVEDFGGGYFGLYEFFIEQDTPVETANQYLASAQEIIKSFVRDAHYYD